MKKMWKSLLFSLFTFLFCITPTFAKEIDLKALGDLVLDANPNAESFYVVGKYVFTMKYVSKNHLNAEDLMLAARSITVLPAEGEVNNTEAYTKMTAYQITSVTDNDGNVIGWDIGKNFVGSHKITKDTKFEIKYIDYQQAKNVYTVTFKDDQDGEVEKQYVIENKHAISPKIEEREGYDFVGWFKCTSDSDCNNVASEQTKFDLETESINSDITLKAKWKIHKFNVTFDKDGGTGEVENQQVEYKNKVSQPSVVTKEGYDFKGWFKCTSVDDCSNIATEDTAFNFNDTEIKEDITLKAKWEIKKFTITFDKDTDLGNAISNQTVEYGKTASQPTPNPKKNGYKFLGWFKCTNSDSCDNIASEHTAFDFKTEIKSDVKLKAKWEEVTYTITFKGEVDGSSNDEFVSDKQTLTLKYPYNISDTSKLPTTDQEGYDFLGWYNDQNRQVQLGASYYINGNTTITGKWKKKELKVIFKNYDKTDHRFIDLKYGDSIENENKPLSRPSKIAYNSYKFLGWFKCDDETCENHAREAYDFAGEGKSVKENLTLIAVFEQIVDTSAIISNFTSSLKSDDFSAFDAGEKNITFNIVHKDTKLDVNFSKFQVAMTKILDVQNVSSVTIGYSEQSVILTKEEISSQLKTLISTLSDKNFDNSQMTDLINKTFTIKIALGEGYKNLDNVDNVTYNVTFKADNFVLVHNETELTNNLTGNKEIIIAENFPITKRIDISKDIVIDGNGKVLTSNIENDKYTFKITNGNVILKDLTLKIYALKPSEYNKETKASNVGVKNTVGIYVDSAATLKVTNVTVDGNRTIDKENLTIDGEPYDSTKVVINENAAVELHGTLNGAGLNYTTELYGSPAVLAAEGAHMNIGGMHFQKYIYTIKRKDELNEATDYPTRVTDFVHYYRDFNSSYVTVVWYVPNSGNRLLYLYLYNEKLIMPKAFTEDGKFYMDGENVFDHWVIGDNRNITPDTLTNIQIKNSDMFKIFAIYSKK